MNRSEFIAAMEAQLIRLPKADRDDILNDYESHFVNGIAEGKTEEEVSAQLGDPAELAAVYLENLPEGAKGAPYIPAEEPADEPQGNPYTEQSNAQYTAPEAQPVYSEPQKAASTEPNVGAIVAVVLLSVFVAVPVVWGIAGVILGAFGTTVGCFAATVALIALGVTTMGLSVVASIGLILLGLALAALAMLALFLGILMVKGTVWLVKWYINWCKELIGGAN